MCHQDFTLEIINEHQNALQNMVMMMNIDYKFNEFLTLALNFSFIRILHSLTTLKLAVLNAFFFYVLWETHWKKQSFP